MSIHLETGIPLFDGPVISYDKNRIYFIHFLLFYKRLDELDDKPSESIIESDELLDKWLIDWKNKKKFEDSNTRNTKAARHNNPVGAKSGVVEFG